MKSPAFQFYAADYLADENVAMMTLEEEGAYIRALAYCWREGSIPADVSKLSRLLKNASNQTLTVVRDCFAICSNDGSRLVHRRLDAEREKQRTWSEKSSLAGKASGKARRLSKIRKEPKTNGGSHLVEPKPNSSFAFASSKEQILKLYLTYPRHTAKAAAEKSIAKALKLRSFDELLAAVETYAKIAREKPIEPQFIPHPATWFNQGRYDDDDLRPKPRTQYRLLTEEEKEANRQELLGGARPNGHAN